MNINTLTNQIFLKKSFLCVGLDSDKHKIPEFLLNYKNPVYEFNKRIVKATHEFAIAYKINTAFYESEGLKGWKSLIKTANYIKKNYPEIFLIADAKRGDIGNTSAMYAKAFFEILPFDAITLSPYMGEDSIKPFLGYKNKWIILLALTSNKGADDFQLFPLRDPLYKNVINISKQWSDANSMMYVVGATKSDFLQEIRQLIPNHFLLIPGIGTQGGNLETVINYGKTNHGGLIVNSSRSIIFADNSVRFADAARQKAQSLQLEMKKYLE